MTTPTDFLPDPMKTCIACGGEGEDVCDWCDGMGWTECECDCGDEHEADCEECRGKGILGDCPSCEGVGMVPFTDEDRELAGQLVMGVLP